MQRTESSPTIAAVGLNPFREGAPRRGDLIAFGLTLAAIVGVVWWALKS